LLEEPETLDEKRRVVAVACALDGPADARARAGRILADVAYKHGAVVHAEEADGPIVLFGLETAGEDDVAEALRFAVAAHEAAREERVALRAGVRQAVARRRAGQSYLVLGEGLGGARRVAGAAGPGRTL